ncbi:MAG: hypothetical protein Q3966_09070 [Neisseria sp.]|nr:hypothetical protein [Neisseria sp.]
MNKKYFKYLLTAAALLLLAAMAGLLYYEYEDSGKIHSAEGIEFGETWVLYHTRTESRRLHDAVRLTLQSQPQGFKSLLATRCDAASCYDLGAVITQIIYRMGEEQFARMLPNLDESEKTWLADMIIVGLEYGGTVNPRQGGTRQFETEFPKLYKSLGRTDNLE